jgi:hypothetical protein
MPELLKPPAISVAMMNFFATQPDFSALAGDMSEEFQQRAVISGVPAAKRWYWREALRNAFALSWRELMRTPVRTALMAIACILAINAVTGIYVGIRWYFFQETPVDLIYDQSPRDVLLLLNFIPPIAIGWLGGSVLRGREWAVALTFTFISVCMGSIALVYLWLIREVHFLAPFEYLMIFGNLLRQGSFWLGALWARRARLQLLDRRIEASDRE